MEPVYRLHKYQKQQKHTIVFLKSNQELILPLLNLKNHPSSQKHNLLIMNDNEDLFLSRQN